MIVKHLIKKIEKEHVRGKHTFDRKYFKGYQYHKSIINGKEMITIYKENALDINIIYFHGGSYVEEAILFHRNFIKRLIKYLHVKVTFIDYPLAPENNYLDTHNMVLECYKKLLCENDELIIMGDSAGGGLALSLVQRLNELNMVTPKKTILLSPWLDISMSNTDIKVYEKNDPTLFLDSLIDQGLLYSKGTTTKNYLVSPIYGNMNNLGEILMIASSKEMFIPDIRKCNNLINNGKNSSSKLYIEDNLFHDFMLVPISKSKKIIDMISDFILNK